MKKPKLIVDNKFMDSSKLSYKGFKSIAELLLDMHHRYPEINSLSTRARANDDRAMVYAATWIFMNYCDGRDLVADHERQKLKVVKKKKRTKKVESTKSVK